MSLAFDKYWYIANELYDGSFLLFFHS